VSVARRIWIIPVRARGSFKPVGKAMITIRERVKHSSVMIPKTGMTVPDLVMIKRRPAPAIPEEKA